MKATRRLIACILAFAVVISVNLGIAFAAPQAQESTNKLQEAEGADVLLYVSADGSDQDGDGTFEKPVATLEKARDLARAEKAKDASKSIKISVGAGKYYLEQPLVLEPQDSGVTYEGQSGAVLSGAATLHPQNWQTYQGDIMVADVEKNLTVDQLFVNGQQQTLARYPNYNAGQKLQGSTSRANIKARSASWADPSGGYIRAIHSNAWGGNSYKITGKNASNALGLSYEWIGDNNRGNGMNDNVMVENIFEEVDAEKEWF